VCFLSSPNHLFLPSAVPAGPPSPPYGDRDNLTRVETRFQTSPRGQQLVVPSLTHRSFPFQVCGRTLASTTLSLRREQVLCHSPLIGVTLSSSYHVLPSIVSTRVPSPIFCGALHRPSLPSPDIWLPPPPTPPKRFFSSPPRNRIVHFYENSSKASGMV